MSRFDLVGVPSSMAAFAPGQERAPAALRAAGLAEALRDSGSDVRDLGDAPTRRWRPDRDHPRAQNVEAVTEIVRETAERLGQTTHHSRAGQRRPGTVGPIQKPRSAASRPRPSPAIRSRTSENARLHARRVTTTTAATSTT